MLGVAGSGPLADRWRLVIDIGENTVEDLPDELITAVVWARGHAQFQVVPLRRWKIEARRACLKDPCSRNGWTITADNTYFAKHVWLKRSKPST